MNRVSRYLKPLALLTVAAFIWENPLITKEAIAQQPAYLSPDFDAIPITVPPPERRDNRICSADIDLVINSIIKSF